MLGIQGRKYILGYGEDSTSFRVSGVIDFRPTINGRLAENATAYLEEPFLLSLLPIIVTVNDDFIDEVALNRMSIDLSVGDITINFVWLYNVTLNSCAQTWLGDEMDVSTVMIKNGISYQETVMFKQKSFPPISWGDFINHVKTTDDHRIILMLTLEFDYFKKTGYILISVEELKGLFAWSYPEGYPYWVEPNALMV